MMFDIPKPTSRLTEDQSGTPTRTWYLFLANIFSIFGPSGVVSVEHGGTGLDETEQGALLYGVDGDEYGILSKTATVSYLDNSGTTNNPAWKAKAALSKANDTNVTLTLTGSPTTALLTDTTITAGWTGQLALSRGGTAASLTAANGGVVYSTASALAINTPGTSGDWLKSVGAGAPAFTAPAALTKGDDTNVTLTLGGSATTALLNAASITAGWAGTLSLSRGGTAKGLTASNGGIVYTDSDSMEVLAGTSTAGQILRSGASSAPSWSTATYPTTATSGRVLIATASNVYGDGPAPVADGTYTIDAVVPGSLTSITFTKGLATAVTTL